MEATVAKPDDELSTIETKIPSRLDRLPWAKFHWMIVIGLGTVWILDGLEVTIVGSISARLGEQGAGLYLNASQVGRAAAFYVAGACVGALFFGQLTDRFGRKKLFLITLAVYIAATIATAFAGSALYFYIARFFTGSGIGGEYAAINSAIDELIPARVRGRVDLMINGSYWIGAALGAVAAIPLLNTSLFAIDVGWRLAFGLGAILGVGILLVRRNVPESPRWLFIHGREKEAEKVVTEIEDEVRRETDDHELPEAKGTITVRQRRKIPFRRIARTAIHDYPKRTILGIALFVGQAFMYNAITFDLGTILSTFFKVSAGAVPYYVVAYAAGNFLGPFLLGRLFDTVGRRPMITATYLTASALAVVLGILFAGGHLDKFGFMAILIALFFFASAGASSAYLTVSEIFPMETRALAIAFFFAVGTAAGGIVGPLLFGHLINTGDPGQVALGFYIGAAVMAMGGIAELLFGVEAAQKPLEEVAAPLTAKDAKEEGEAPEGAPAEGEKAEEEPVPAMAAAAGAGALGRRRRYRPGPGHGFGSRGMMVSAPVEDEPLDTEVGIIARALAEHGEVDRRELARLVGARFWGPGRFSAAVRAASEQGEAQAVARHRFAPPVARSTS